MLKKINNKGQPKNTKFEIYSKRRGRETFRGGHLARRRGRYTSTREKGVWRTRGERERGGI
jgi:hypothetical protein